MPVPIAALAAASGQAKNIIPTAAGVAKTIVGLFKSGKAKREADRLAASRPKFVESPYVKDALALAQSELSTGLSGEAENAYEQGIDRSLSNSLDVILKGGGTVNNVAQLFDNSQQGRQSLLLMKENLRLNQINNLVRAQSAAEEQREKAFQFNEWAPWADRAQANATARQGAENMIWGGIDAVGSAIMQGASSNQGQNQLSNYFTGNNPVTGSAVSTPASTSFSTVPMTGSYSSPGESLDPLFINPNYGSFVI